MEFGCSVQKVPPVDTIMNSFHPGEISGFHGNEYEEGDHIDDGGGKHL